MSDRNDDRILTHSGAADLGSTPPHRASEGIPMWGSTGGKVQIFFDVVLLILTALNLYWLSSTRDQFRETARLQSDRFNLLTRRVDASDEQYAQLNGELKVTAEKLGLTAEELGRARKVAASIKKQQQEAVRRLDEAIAQKANADELTQLQSDSGQKFDSLSGDLVKTNEALQGTKHELAGDIARTHDELIALAHKTDRDYFEFTLGHKGAREMLGSLMIELARTSPKRNQFTLNLYFDDKRVQQKDRAFMVPVFFYVSGASSPLEIVVNQIGKDHVSGYVSTPRNLYSGVPNVLAERPTG